MRIEEALEKFIVQLRADGRSEHTIGQYHRHVRLFARWVGEDGLDGEIEGIDHEVLARFLNSDAARVRSDGGRKRETSTNALRTSLRCFFGYAHAARWLLENPARLVRRARTSPPPPRALSDDEQWRFLAALDEARTRADRRDRVLFTLLLRCGLRIGSALGLRVEDVDLDAGELAITHAKNDRPMTVLLPRDVGPLLEGWLGELGRDEGWLFPGYGCEQLCVRSADRRFEEWARRAELRPGATPHALRHSFATRLLRQTGDLALVQAALHHASILSTTRYLALDDGRLRAALGA